MESYILSDLFDIDALKTLTESLSAALQISIAIWGSSGERIVENSDYGNFCQEVLGQSPAGNALFEQSVRELCTHAGVSPYICFFRSIGWASAVIGILVDDIPVAYLVAGQVRLAGNDLSEEECRSIARSLGIDEDSYLKGFRNLPVITVEHFNRILDMISLLVRQFAQLGYANLRLRTAVSSLEDQEILHQHEKVLLETLAERDSMTKLYNQRKFEETVSVYSEQTGRQICMVSADANFLKLTNDIFGHESGDLLIKAIAKILNDLAKDDWLVTRCGGDEFRVILPDTSLETALDYCRRVARNCRHDKSLTLPLSVALGAAEWDSRQETLLDCFSRADAKMYQNKTALKHELRIPNFIMERLYDRQILDRAVVSLTTQFTYEFALYMGFAKDHAKEISVAAHYQDIGKAKLPESLVIRGQSRTEAEQTQIRMHVTHGYTMARQFDELYKIADIIHCSHEDWDGRGYPSGVKGSAIPIEARIIRITNDYTCRTHPTITGGYYTEAEAKQKLVDGSGSIYDADLVSKFLTFLQERESGRFTAGTDADIETVC